MLGRSLGESGSTSAVGLAIAAATIATAFVAAELMVAEPSGKDARDTTYSSSSRTGLELIVADPGLSATGEAWENDPDQMTRFGLAKEGQRNFLDYDKIRALRNGTMYSAANDHPDYPEVRSALGLGLGDFHLRSYPVLPGLDDPRWTKEQNGRLAYFARYSGASAAVGVTINPVLSPTSLNVSVALNNLATAPAIFVASVSLGDSESGHTVVTEERHTRLLSPGETQTVWVEFHPLASWDASIDGVKVDVQDPYGNAAVDASGNAVGPRWIMQTPPTSSPYSYGLLMHAADFYVVTGQPVEFIADHYTGTGDKVNGATGQFVLVGPNGAEWHNTTAAESLPKNNNQVYTYTCANCTTPGVYTGVLYGPGWVRKVVDQVYVSPSVLFTEKTNMDPLAIKEIALLRELAAGFDPTRYHNVTNPQGDVFGDDTNGPGEMADLLSRYTTLVIGSEVAQTALNPASVKYAIAQWVQDGGNLVVLGTYNRESRWLEPVYHAAQDTANGGISAPDPTHPVLLSPNRLSYERYLDRARAWDVDEDAPFTHVLSRGGNGNSRDDTIAVSNPGAYNNGTVVLTSYMPGSLTTPQDDAEAKRLLHNLLSQSYTMLFLDYGPPIPAGVPVGSASRLAAVEHPNVPGAVVEVRLVMYVFG